MRAMVLAAALASCAAPADRPRAHDVGRAAPRSSAPSAVVPLAPGTASAAAEAATVASAEAAPSKPAKFTTDEAIALLYPEGATLAGIGCEQGGGDDAIRCAIEKRYGDDKKGLATARALFDELGSVAGLEREQTMEGGWRGQIHLVPERPIGPYQRQFDWVLEAQRDIKAVFDGIEAKKKHAVRYRHSPIGWKFMRSVGKRTPSAYASDWRVGYNVSGSLNTSMVSVRDTVVHEIFHDNDFEDGDWSRKTLGDVFDSIVARCGTRIDCLTPYSPMKTIVVGGTYYSFQPNNGDACHEYAAELASRYFIETRAALKGEKLAEKPFKCGPPENRRTWDAIVDEFFGGVDLSPACDK